MPRKPLILSNEHPYHVTNRANNREWFYIPTQEVWEIFKQVLGKAYDLYETEIWSFVLMSNHYHLVLRTPQGNLGAVVRYLQTEVARGIQKESGRINHVFGTRYKWSLLWNNAAVAFAYKYVARNPVVAGLSAKVEDYPFSTIHSLDKGLADSIPTVERITPRPAYIPRDWPERLEWLNQPSPKEHDAIIAKALRRYEFEFSTGNDVRRTLVEISRAYGIPIPGVSIPATFSAEK